MASIGVAYFVTLCLYPGIVSEIISCKFESWMPVILMTAFNASDLLGKVSLIILYKLFLDLTALLSAFNTTVVIIQIQTDKVVEN